MAYVTDGMKSTVQLQFKCFKNRSPGSTAVKILKAAIQRTQFSLPAIFLP